MKGIYNTAIYKSAITTRKVTKNGRFGPFSFNLTKTPPKEHAVYQQPIHSPTILIWCLDTVLKARYAFHGNGSRSALKVIFLYPRNKALIRHFPKQQK